MSGDEGEAGAPPRSWARGGQARPTVVVRRAGPTTGGRPLVAHEDGVRPPKGWPESVATSAAGSDAEDDDGQGRDDGDGEEGGPVATYVLWVDEGGAVQTGVLRAPAATGDGRLASWVEHGLLAGPRRARARPARTRAAVARRLDRALAGAGPGPDQRQDLIRQLAVQVDGRGHAGRLRLWRAGSGEPAMPEHDALAAAREDLRLRTRLARSDRGVWSLVPAALLVAPGLLASALAPAFVVPVVVAAVVVGLVLAVLVGDRLARWRTERLLAPLGAQRITVPGRP